MAKEGEQGPGAPALPARCGSSAPIVMATIGQVGNLDHGLVKLGKAGRKRHMGIRPTVRGSVMNPRDHPHGGGEGKSPIGGQPQTPWGKPAMGYKTRRRKLGSDLIVRPRKKK